MVRTTLTAAVGTRVAQLRAKRGLTQDGLARRLRDYYGLGWDRPTVGRLEAGERESLDLGALVALALVLDVEDLAELTGEGSEMLTLADGLAVRGGALAGLLRGERPRAIPPADFEDAHSEMGALLGVIKSAEKSDAERKAAVRLGIDATALGVAACHLWGRSLTQERDRRVEEATDADASPRSVQATRGHVTRTLLAEVEQHLKETHESATEKEEESR